ncbi:MAG: MOSC domain-containing protein [Microthrixaceae bacterium]
MQVDELWRYPVKSMVGECVGEVDLDGTGIMGDREWACRDLERGGIRGAKKIAGLMRLAAAHVAGPGGPVRITLPDGGEVLTTDTEVDARVSAAVGHPVRLESLQPPEDLDHYRRGAPDSDDLMEELHAIFGREEGEPLPDLSVFPPEIVEFESPPGTYYDAFPLLLLSTAALASLADALPDSVVDVRRFRPSVVVDTGDDVSGHPEFDWVGRRLRMGGAELEVVTRCPRCVMVTREVTPDVPADRAVLRHVVRELGQDLGVYATVTVPGRVQVGDPVILLD